MAILIQDEENIIKCPKCNSRTFYEKDINSYVQISPRIYRRHKIAISLTCEKCNSHVRTIELINNQNIIKN